MSVETFQKQSTTTHIKVEVQLSSAKTLQQSKLSRHFPVSIRRVKHAKICLTFVNH